MMNFVLKMIICEQLGVLGSADVPLGEITQPTLVMFGEDDMIVPAGNGPLVMEQLTAASRKELVIIPGQGHMCWGISTVAAQVASRHVEEFLGEASSANL